ncbi:MAG: glutamyl-tRNA synthetase [archaeon]|jgi:glutamyl-tRNA synthetase
MITSDIIRAYALKNAVEHDGNANVGSVVNALFNHGLKKENIKDIMGDVQKIIREVNALDSDEQHKTFSKVESLIGKREEREGLPDLENVGKNGVVMRFAPAASGQLHLGHVIAGIPSSLYVKKYGGTFYVRIEDTNPEKTDPDSYAGFKRDLDWLFGNVHEYIIQSDRLLIYYKYIEKLLDKHAVYICTCDNEAFKKLILKQKACACRDLSILEQKKRWEKMLNKKGYKEGEVVVRFKSDLAHPNPALRDFPLARVNTKKHPRQGEKYRVWPLMNLAVTVDDLEYTMTHVIRGKDHKDNAERQKRIYQALGLENKFPVTLFVGRIKFSDVVLSKRKIKAAIDEGNFEGWDDVRLPTIVALRKRGYQSEAFNQLAIQRGISEVDKVMTQKDLFDVINNFNRDILRGIAHKVGFEKSDKKKANVTILMPDATQVYGVSDVRAKDGDIIYFNKFGYARLNVEGKKKIFWYCHE